MNKHDSQRRQVREERQRLSPGLIGFMVGLSVALLWVLFGFWRLLFILALSGQVITLAFVTFAIATPSKVD